MATVRFSKELIDQILSNAKAKMQPAVDKALQDRPDPAWGQKIYDTLFSDVLPTLRQLPDGWLKTVKEIKIDKVGSVRCDMTFSLNGPTPWPLEFKETALAKKESYWGDQITLKDDLVWSEFHAEVVAQNQKIIAAKARQNEFVASVRAVVHAYTTLAPALKAWPPLWDLIPEATKDKHREIKERVKGEVSLNVDLDKLTAMSTMARLGI